MFNKSFKSFVSCSLVEQVKDFWWHSLKEIQVCVLVDFINGVSLIVFSINSVLHFDLGMMNVLLSELDLLLMVVCVTIRWCLRIMLSILSVGYILRMLCELCLKRCMSSRLRDVWYKKPGVWNENYLQLLSCWSGSYLICCLCLLTM